MPYEIFLKSNNLYTKKSVVVTIFLKSRFHCILTFFIVCRLDQGIDIYLCLGYDTSMKWNKTVIRLSSDCHQTVIRLSSDCHYCDSEVSSEHHQSVIRLSSECHQSVIRMLSVHHQSIIRPSSDHHQIIIRPLWSCH